MEIASATNESAASLLASWNRQRTTDELLSFITSHQSALPDDIEIE